MTSMDSSVWHAQTLTAVLDAFDASLDGLASQEVPSRRERYKDNILPVRRTDSWWAVFGRQFANPLIVVLLVACVVSMWLGDFVDASVIAAAIVINTTIGFLQEHKAGKALRALRSLIQPEAVVRRDGHEVSVLATLIVPGDILILHAGDRVTADAKIVRSIDMVVNEATLTGESLPVQKAEAILPKDMPLAQRSNMVYAGTNVMGGRGEAIVVATGLQTELGRIATLVEQTREPSTPLQKQLGSLARRLAVLVVILASLLFFAGVAFGRTLVEMFEMSVALAVAAIPEGLTVSVTIVLAIGMQRILRRKSLVRQLVAAETLGSVSVMCTDKTGTITQGEMRVTHLMTPAQTWVFPFPVGEEPSHSMHLLLEGMILCNDAMSLTVDDQDVMQGNPTDRAFRSAVLEQKLDVRRLLSEFPRVWEIPFDSAHKYMVTGHDRGQQLTVFLKGAPDVVLPFCSHIQVDGAQEHLTTSRRTQLKDQVLSLTRTGMRVIALAVRDLPSSSSSLLREDLGDFVFVGFVGLRDPLREETRGQIESAKAAGIQTVMVTGDHPETARSIAVQAGWTVGPEALVTGNELDTWSDEELEKRVSKISVYARVEPRHKIRIVRAWQARGEVVAMTGDGVNDAPALKAADIGVSVGSGTEVAKQASDLIILDNHLGTITAAIEEGRVIFDNIRKIAVYLLADSFTELILIGGSILLGLPIPLLPAQILWINFVADSFPNIGLTMEPAEKDVMRLPPRKRNEPVLNREMLTIIFVIGAVTDIALFGLYLWLRGIVNDMDSIRSIMFAAVGIDSLLYVFAVKSLRRTIFHINPFSNLWLLAGVAVGFAFMFLALMHPFFQAMFQITPLNLPAWGLLIMMALIKLVGIEITKGYFFHETPARFPAHPKTL